MQVSNISNQNFEGRVIGCSWFKPKHKKIFKQARPCLENMVKNKDFDLKITLHYGKIRIGIWKQPQYTEPLSDTCASWISSAKEYLNII